MSSAAQAFGATGPLRFDGSARLVGQGARWVAGGVNSAFRVGMQPGPLVFERGEGPYLFDADGNRLIDFYGGMGAMVLGHNPKEVQQAVRKYARDRELVLIDLAAEMNGRREYFRDLVHFNDAGARRAAALVHARLPPVSAGPDQE